MQGLTNSHRPTGASLLQMGICKQLLLSIFLSAVATTVVAEDDYVVVAGNAGNGNNAGNANNGIGPGNSDFGRSRGHVGGAAALARLGKELPAVAQRNGMSEEKLSKTLETDPDLLVDPNLDLVYKCTLLDILSEDGTTAHHHHHHRKLAEVDAAAVDPAIAALVNSSTGVPLLHSRTGSNFKIYLDFDGHTAIGTTWNSNNGSNWACSPAGTCGALVSPAFDYDGLPLPFSDIEKRMIVSTSC